MKIKLKMNTCKHCVKTRTQSKWKENATQLLKGSLVSTSNNRSVAIFKVHDGFGIGILYTWHRIHKPL